MSRTPHSKISKILKVNLLFSSKFPFSIMSRPTTSSKKSIRPSCYESKKRKKSTANG